MFVLVVFVEMVAKRESALVLHTTHRAHAQCRKRIVATVKKKAIEKMPIEIFLFFENNALKEEGEIA